MKRIFLVFFIILILANEKSFSQQYLQLRFASTNTIPTFTISGGYYDLSCNDGTLEAIFDSYSITNFTREYPAADNFSGVLGDKLKRVYKIEITGDYNQLMADLDFASSSDIDNFCITKYPEILYIPNDYYNCWANCNGYPGFPQASNHLNLTNAAGAWDVTRGLECIKIGISDQDFVHHIDLDSKIDGIGSGVIIHPNTYIGQNAHGTAVAGIAAAETNNGSSTGIAALGNKVKLRYYNTGYNSILEAAHDGCKVINCSWVGPVTSTFYIPSQNDQDVIDLVYQLGITVVAAAGNNNSGIATDYFFPASNNHVISVTSIGSGRPVGSTVLNNWNDCHRWFLNTNDPNYNHTHQHNDKVDLSAPGYFVETLGSFDYQQYEAGTSLASPQVAAAAALLYSLNPTLTPDQVEYFLKQGSENIYGVWDNYLWAGKLGTGRLNAGNSLELARSSACMPSFTGLLWEGSYDQIVWKYITPEEYYIYPYIKITTTSNLASGATLRADIHYRFDYSITSPTNAIILNMDRISGTLVDQNKYRAPKWCQYPFEIYIRQESGSCCVGAYYKEKTWSNDPNCEVYKANENFENNFLLYTNENKLKLYPSPAKDNIQVILTDNKLPQEFQIIGMDGRIIKAGKLTNNQTSVNIVDLSKGTYLFKTDLYKVKFIKE